MLQGKILVSTSSGVSKSHYTQATLISPSNPGFDPGKCVLSCRERSGLFLVQESLNSLSEVQSNSRRPEAAFGQREGASDLLEEVSATYLATSVQWLLERDDFWLPITTIMGSPKVAS